MPKYVVRYGTMRHLGVLSTRGSDTFRRGVRVAEGGAFAVGRGGHRHGVRLSLNAARSRDELRRALDVIVDCLADQPSTACSIL